MNKKHFINATFKLQMGFWVNLKRDIQQWHSYETNMDYGNGPNKYD